MDQEEIIDFLRPERLLRATVRIWNERPDKGGELLGTAFFIAPRHALTAAHVVREIAPNALYLHVSWGGGFYSRVLNVVYAEEPIDAALLEISIESKTSHASSESIVTVGQALPLTIGTPLKMVGFADAGSSAEIRPATVTGIDGQANAVIIDPPPAKGMSGGPALSPDGLLRGMIWARDQDKGRGYLTPLSALRQLIAQADPGRNAEPVRMFEYPALAEDRHRLVTARALLLRWRELYADRRDELEAAAVQARAFQRATGVLPYQPAFEVAELANAVASAMKSLPVDDLQFATHYGLGIHHSIFVGLAYLVVESEWHRLKDADQAYEDSYAYEMMARLLESAVAMLTFRPDALPQGFLEPTTAMDISGIRAAQSLILGRRESVNELTIISIGMEPHLVGALVARPRPLHVKAARQMADGSIEVLATDHQYLYRWSTDSPRPTAQYPYSGSLFAAFPSATPGSSPIVGQLDSAVRELYLDGQSNQLVDAPADGKLIACAVWDDPDEAEATYLIQLSKEGLVRSRRLGSEAEPVERNFDKELSDPIFPYVWVSNNTQIQMTSVEGFPCAMIFSQTPQRSSLLFLDPKSLRPIKPNRQIACQAIDCIVAAERWLILSHFGVLEGQPLLSVHDLSASSDAPAGGLTHCSADMADAISLAARDVGHDACEVYFVRNLLYPINSYRLCKWSWPENRLEEFPDIEVESFFPVQR